MLGRCKRPLASPRARFAAPAEHNGQSPRAGSRWHCRPAPL